MIYGTGTDKGRIREVNEDCFRVISGYYQIPLAFLIADGMGGHKAGEIASRTAIDSACDFIFRNPGLFSDRKTIKSSIACIFDEANSAVCKGAAANGDNNGMGTTLLITLTNGNRLYIGNIGDSRAYRVRNGAIRKLTTDHSYVEELIRQGSITRKEAEKHPHRNILTKAVGCDNKVDADVTSTEISEGDIYLLCTDGLTNMVPEEQILNILLKVKDPDAACRKLIQQANDNGGEDNITAIVFRKEEAVL